MLAIYTVNQYSQFPVKHPDEDRIIKKFSTLKLAMDFSIMHNTAVDYKGRYIHNGNDGYYVWEIGKRKIKYVLPEL